MKPVNLKLIITNLILFAILVVALIVVNWESVGAQEVTPTEPTAVVTIKEEAKATREVIVHEGMLEEECLTIEELEEQGLLFEDELIIEGDFFDPYTEAASIIGITVEALFEALENDQSIADVATANGVDPQTVTDALVEADNAQIDKDAAEWDIPAEEIELWKSESIEWISDLVTLTDSELTEKFEAAFDEELFFAEEGYFDPYTEAAAVIGISTEALFDALDNDQSIADVATANGVDPQTVIDALVEADNAQIDKDAAEWDIPAEEVELWKSESEKWMTDLVESTLSDLDQMMNDEMIMVEEFTLGEGEMDFFTICGELESESGR